MFIDLLKINGCIHKSKKVKHELTKTMYHDLRFMITQFYNFEGH